ncbi:unnamed protein product [Effrenium voratum]|uniref:Uncharacterized protein n=1 Tax=Effrenium voratum TaxID=2562239 RepID=A0AA36HVQ9_9DINO|nr:unnamed protein product [Effrenium voratum]
MDGMASLPPASALEAMRRDCAAAELVAEKRRQELEKAKHSEDQKLRELHVEQTQKAHEDRAASKRVLDEMKQVRRKVHSQLRAAEAKAFHSIDASHNALARAGQRALTARQHTDQWEAHADITERQTEQSIQKDKECLDSIREVAARRVAVMEDIATERVQKSHKLLQDSKQQELGLTKQQQKQLETRAHQAARTGQIQVNNVTRAGDQAKAQMKMAEAKAAEEKMRMTRDIERSIQAGASRIAAAERELKVQEHEITAALSREQVCASQIKRVAQELKDNSQEEFRERKKELEAMLERAAEYEHSKKKPHQDAQVSMQEKTEVVTQRGHQAALAARQRAGLEVEDIQRRLVEAKEQLAKLEVKCAACLKELNGRWEDAKVVYAAKVEEVERQTQDLLEKLEAHKALHEDYCAQSLRQVEELQQERQAAARNQGALSQELVKHRATFCQQKSAQTRRQAEARLEETKRHVEDMRRRSQERAEMGKDIAQEKVRIAQQRFTEQVEVAERRANEAMDARDKAKAAFLEALARCSGAADEAQRRGLHETAQLLMPKDAWCGFSTPRPKTEESTRPETASGVEVWTLGKEMKETSSTVFPDRGGTPLEANLKEELSMTDDTFH